MGLLCGKSEEEQFEDILANKYKCAKQNDKVQAVTDTDMRHIEPFTWRGVVRSLRDFAFLDVEDKGY